MGQAFSDNIGMKGSAGQPWFGGLEGWKIQDAVTSMYASMPQVAPTADSTTNLSAPGLGTGFSSTVDSTTSAYGALVARRNAGGPPSTTFTSGLGAAPTTKKTLLGS